MILIRMIEIHDKNENCLIILLNMCNCSDLLKFMLFDKLLAIFDKNSLFVDSSEFHRDFSSMIFCFAGFT